MHTPPAGFLSTLSCDSLETPSVIELLVIILLILLVVAVAKRV